MRRYDYGVVSVQHKGKTITTSVGSKFDDMVETADDKVYKTSKVLSIHEGRSDSISDVLYDTPEYWWFLQHVNNISDPLQQLTSGTRIKLPNE